MAKLGLPLDLVATVLGQEAGGSETRVLWARLAVRVRDLRSR